MNPEDEAYNAGRYNLPPTSGNWDRYVEGQNDRRRWEQTTSNSSGPAPSGSGGSHDGAGAGGALIAIPLLMLLFSMLALVAASAVASVLASLCILVLARISEGWGRVDFAETYKVTFRATLVYLGSTVLIGCAATYFRPADSDFSFAAALLRRGDELARLSLAAIVSVDAARTSLAAIEGHVAVDSYRMVSVVTAAVCMHGPGLLAAAKVLSNRDNWKWTKPFRYLPALAVAALILPASILASGWAIEVLTGDVHTARLGPVSVGRAASVVGGLVAAHAVAGGLVIALAYYLATRRRLGEGGYGFLATYLHVVLGLIAYGVCLFSAMYFFAVADDFVKWMIRAGDAPDPLLFASRNLTEIPRILPGFLLLHAASSMMFAWTLSSWLHGQFRKFAEYAKAFAIGGVLSLGTLPCLLVVAARLVK